MSRKLDVSGTDNVKDLGLTCRLQKCHSSGFVIVDGNEMDGNLLIVTCTLHDKGNVIKSHPLIDCGATSYTFIDEDYAYHYHLPSHLPKSLKNLTIIDGRPITAGAITHITCTSLVI
jgi:hypothetical protein